MFSWSYTILVVYITREQMSVTEIIRSCLTAAVTLDCEQPQNDRRFTQAPFCTTESESIRSFEFVTS